MWISKIKFCLTFISVNSEQNFIILEANSHCMMFWLKYYTYTHTHTHIYGKKCGSHYKTFTSPNCQIGSLGILTLINIGKRISVLSSNSSWGCLHTICPNDNGRDVNPCVSLGISKKKLGRLVSLVMIVGNQSRRRIILNSNCGQDNRETLLLPLLRIQCLL